MLRHLGTKRTYVHNVKLASLLCLTAGFVNAAGFLGFSVLTTNVTGHAALFAERIAMQDWETARVVALWMFLFLAGAFVSSLIVSFIGRNQRFSYVIPILIEMVVLLGVSILGYQYNHSLVAEEILPAVYCLLWDCKIPLYLLFRVLSSEQHTLQVPLPILVLSWDKYFSKTQLINQL